MQLTMASAPVGALLLNLTGVPVALTGGQPPGKVQDPLDVLR